MRAGAVILAAFLATPASAQARDPASVDLPAETLLKLKLGGDVRADYASAFEALAPDGALFILGPGTTREVQAAADRARVMLLYQQYDLNGDGSVARDEYDRHADVTWGTDLDEAGRRVLEREWEAADSDDDDVVTAAEMRALALARHPVPPNRPLNGIEEAILTMDLDNDGFVYWDEVEAVLAAH